MLRFDTLILEGFGSLLGPEVFEFQQNGLTLIKGLNGAGKTTMISGITWVAYGSMLKEKAKPTTWDHVQPTDYKGVKGQLDFWNGKHDITIIRCENYKGKVEGSKGGKRLILKIDGEVQQQYGDKISTQKAINKLIGMSFDLFINSIVFGQKMKRIIESTGPKQKGIFDEAFEVTYVNEAKNSVDNDYKQTRDEHATLSNDLTQVNNQITSTKELYRNSLDSEERFEILKLESIKKAILRLSDREEELSTLKKEEKKLSKKLTKKQSFVDNWDYDGWEKADDDYQLSKSAIVLKNTAILQEEQSLKRINQKILKQPTKCDKCGTPLNKNTRKKIIRELKEERKKAKVQIQTLKVELSGLEDDKDFKKAELDAFNEKKKKYDKVQSDIRFINNQLENSKKKKAEIEEDIKKLRNEKIKAEKKKLEIKSTTYKKKLSKLKSKKKPLRLALKNNKEQLELLEWLIKDPLSNAGLKTYIFNSMLGAVNDELYKYASILGFEVEFAINLDSKRKEFYSLVAKEGHIVPFNDLSGGQQQLVNIAIAFAIHAVVNKGNNVNILIMDEVFESLDAVNIDIVNELIQMKAETKAIYLITHQKDFNPRNCSTMYFELSSSGATRIV